MNKALIHTIILLVFCFSTALFSNKQDEVDFLDKVMDEKSEQNSEKPAEKKTKKPNTQKVDEALDEKPPIQKQAKRKKKPRQKTQPPKENTPKSPNSEENAPIVKGSKKSKDGYKTGNWVHEEFIPKPENLSQYPEKKNPKPFDQSQQDNPPKTGTSDNKSIKEKKVIPILPVDNNPKEEDSSIFGKMYSIVSKNLKILFIIGLVLVFALYRWRHSKNVKTTTFTRLKR